MGNFGIDVNQDLTTPGSISVVEPYGGSQEGSLWGGIMQGVGTVLNMIPLGWTQVLGTALTIGGQVVKGALNEDPTAGSTKVKQAEEVDVKPLTSVGDYNPYSSQVSGPNAITGISGSAPSGLSANTMGSIVGGLANVAKSTGAIDSLKDLFTSKAGDVSGFGSGIDWSNLGSGDWGSLKSDALKDLYSYGNYGSESTQALGDTLSNMDSSYWDSLLSYFSY